MTKVVFREPWQSAPDAADPIVVVHDARTCMMTTWCGDSVAPHRECWPLDQMLDRACKEAGALGIATIYVRETTGLR